MLCLDELLFERLRALRLETEALKNGPGNALLNLHPISAYTPYTHVLLASRMK